MTPTAKASSSRGRRHSRLYNREITALKISTDVLSDTSSPAARASPRANRSGNLSRYETIARCFDSSRFARLPMSGSDGGGRKRQETDTALTMPLKRTQGNAITKTRFFSGQNVGNVGRFQPDCATTGSGPSRPDLQTPRPVMRRTFTMPPPPENDRTPTWQRSTFCTNDSNCVEMARLPGARSG